MQLQRLKKNLKLGILIFGFSIFLANCQEDSLDDIQNDKFSNILIKITDFNEITSNKNISNKLKSFSYKSKSSSSTYKDILYNAEYGFTIDTDIVKYVVSGDYHSYNFIITRDNPIDDKLENLVLSLNNDGGYNAYIIKYDFTPEEFENIDISELENRRTLYTPIDFDSSFLQNKSSKSKMPNEYECDEVWGWEELDPGDEGYNVGEGNEEAPTYGWALISFDCGYSSESGGGSDPENYDGEGGSTSGGGDGGIVTAPNTTPNYSQLKNFESGTLSTEVRNYYQSDSNIKNTIDNYLIENNFSYTSKQDAKKSLELGDILSLNFELFYWTFNNRDSEDLYDIEDYLSEAINITTEIENFVELAIEALMNNKDVDFEEAYIYTDTPDDNFVYQGVKQLIPNPLTLENGSQISITFGTTKDQINANQPVSIDLISGLKFSIEQANGNLQTSEKITSIYIMCTTNGHGTTGSSNHLKSTAIDISRINGNKMILTGVTNQIIELQKAMNSFQHVRENFGPQFKYKYFIETNSWNYNFPIDGHKDHIHFSVRK